MLQNELKHQHSLYLLQHKDNPVAWQSWSDATLERARAEDKPIFLSAGYATCHWCRVMEKESFEDVRTANILNKHFIPVKLDREEHPDIDRKYQFFLSSTGNQGGWPSSMFLLPDGTPFYGGTFFPKEARGGLPAFTELLLKIAHLFENDRDRVEEIVENFRVFQRDFIATEFVYKPVGNDICKAAVAEFAKNFDYENGGMNRNAKFPNIPLMLFLLEMADDEKVLSFLTKTADMLCTAGIYDHIHGGFYRYTVDKEWMVPHFEKMLTDNALNPLFLTRLFDITQNPLYLRTARKTLDFVLSSLSSDYGLFSAMDADTLVDDDTLSEGYFYRIQPSDMEGLTTQELELISQHTTLHDGVIRINTTDYETILKLEPIFDKIAVNARTSRTPARIDTKVVAAFNMHFIYALLEYAEIGNDTYYYEQALNLFNKIKHFHISGDFVFRLNYHGEVKDSTTLEDFTTTLAVLIKFFELTKEKDFLMLAQRITERIIADFYADGIFHYDTQLSVPESFDEALPSPHGYALLTLLENRELLNIEPDEIMLDFAFDRIKKYPTGHPTLFRALKRFED